VQFNTDKLQAGGGSGLGLWITKGSEAYLVQWSVFFIISYSIIA